MSEVSKSNDPGAEIILMPYSHLIGQTSLKLALETAFIADLNGVLIRGQRGTGKSTAARSFAKMVFKDHLPVTLPINATEDRVIGGWDLGKLLKGEQEWKKGLLEQANEGLLFVDEVNLLEDHIVNIILDVTSTNILTIQQNDKDVRGVRVKFMLIGTMNPDEGELRPQLLDRFGLTAELTTSADTKIRRAIIDEVLALDLAKAAKKENRVDRHYDDGINEDAKLQNQLKQARDLLKDVTISDELVEKCLELTTAYKVHGHRADILLPLTAKAAAARDYVTGLTKKLVATKEHVRAVAPIVLMHRRQDENRVKWVSNTIDGKAGKTDDQRVGEILDIPDGQS